MTNYKIHTIQIAIDDDTYKVYSELKKKWKLSNYGMLHKLIEKEE